MESGNGGASSKGVLIPVPDSSDVFKNSILTPLQSAYLYDESKQFFRYKSAVLVKNSALEEKYDAFRAKRREAGYSEEDLEESYGFLLFDDVNKANALGETGVLTGNSTCTTLGDPSKGVYISMYSDCLDLNRWYHGKSGYIAIIRLTKGKVKKVSENYTQNFTAPTVGFDCHVSEQLPSVSAQTSSFLAFERTQCYMYELLNDGSNATAQSPSAACPFAIVSFSYTDTKAAIAPPQEKSEEKKSVFYYLPWRGQLQIGSQLYSVGLRSKAGALIPTKLPPVVKVDWAISMLDLRQLLPRAVFETCFTGEAFLDGLYCSLCELVPTEAEETNSLAQLLWGIKEKDLALAVLLSDGGFLILLHSSHFLTYDDAWSCATEILQGLLVFPDSRVVMRDTKFGQRNPSMTSEILRILPVLSYAEGEAEKTPIDPSEDLCEVLAQHMQSYTALINPGLGSSPSREVSMFPFQYDVPDTHLYSSPEWTDGAMQSFRSYLSKPASFQLPVSKASEILAAGQEERREDLDDDVYICISSPEEAPQEISMELEDNLSDLKSPDSVETSVDNGTSAGTQDDLTAVPHNVVPNDLPPGHPTKGSEKCSDLSELNKTDDVGADNLLTPPTSDDLPAELIVSITSAEKSVTDETLRAKLQTTDMNSLCDETDYTKKLLDIPEVTSFTGKKLKMRRGLSKGWKKVPEASVEPSSLQTLKTPVEVDSVNIQKDEHTNELSDHPQLNNPSNWRKLQRRKRKCGKLSTKNRKVRSAIVGLAIAEEEKTDPGLQRIKSTTLKELEACPLRRKMERWDLKPIISECGRILVPHGSTDFADQIKSLEDTLQSTKDEQCSEKMLLDAPPNADDAVKMDPESCTAPEMAVEETEAAKTVDGGNDLQNITVSDVNPEKNILKQSDDGNGSLPLNPESNSSKNDHTDTLPSQTIQEKHTDNLSPEKCPSKSEFLLSKLKSVLLRGKRKTDLVTEDTTPNTPQNTEPCLKKSKEVDSETEAFKCNNTNTPSTNAVVEEASKILPVDPLFAFALGLTPKVIPEKVLKTQDLDTQKRMDSTKTQEPTVSDKQPQIIHRPPSIFTRRGRIKTLKKHQSISAECIKKKWWLHFQTPACFASEKLKYKDCTSDNSVRKTEKMNSAYSPADALNLLADLALGASNDQVPPQPNPAFEREPETSLKKSDLKKDLTSAEQESVLHALLRQPAARSTQPHESPAPSHLVVNSEVVGLVSKEHAYSLPPSSSLLLDLPGTPFQVSPLSGSARLLHHDQTMYGIKTLQPSVDQEDRSEYDRTPQYLKKHMVHKQKFRYTRTFVNKEGSIKVTRHWQENYDFNLDSKFTSDSKDKTIIRALHGPWDFSIQDTNEEVRLIVHMWIGLFYSRSTPRFFHVESNFTYPCSEESDSLEMTSGVVKGPVRTEHKAMAPASFPSVTDTSDPLISAALDLSKKDNTTLDQDSLVLDLSLRNSSACPESVTSDPQVNKKGTFDSSEQKEPSETLNSLKSLQEHHECYEKMVNSKEIVPEVKNGRKTHDGEKTGTLRQAVCQENTDIPSFKGDGKVIPPQKVTDSASIKPNTALVALGIGQVLHGCNEERINMKEGTENSGTKKRGLVKQDVLDSFKFAKREKKDLNMEAEDAVQTDDHGKNELKNLEICKMKGDPCQEVNTDPSQKVNHAGDDSVKKSDIVCNGNLESEKLLSREEHKGVSQEQDEHFKAALDCGPKHEGKVMKEDDHLREDRFDEKDDCISPVNVDRDLNDQPLPGMFNGPDLVKENYITESNHKAQMNEQPSLANTTKDACHDLPLKMPCSDGITLANDYAISEEFPHTPLGNKFVYTESAIKKISKKDMCLRDETQFKTAVLPMFDESSSTPQTKDNVEKESQNKEISDISFGQSNNCHEAQETKSTENEVKDDNATHKEKFQHQPHSPQCEVPKICEAQVAFTKETDLRTDETNDGLDRSCTGVEIPFIGIDASEKVTVQVKNGSPAHKKTVKHQPHSPQCEVPKICEAQVAFTKETDLRTDKTNEELDKSCNGAEIPLIEIDASEEDTVQPHASHPQSRTKEVVQGQEKIPFITDSSYPKASPPNEICSTSQVCSKKGEPSKILLLDVNESHQPVDLGCESDNRCPTPTIDEKPCGYMPCSSPCSSTSAFSGSKTGNNLNHKSLSTSLTPVNDELPCEKKLCHTSIVKTDSNPRQVFHPDLEVRTLRVLQSIDKFFSKSNHTDKSCQIETAKRKKCVDQFLDSSSKCIPSSLALGQPSVDFKDKKIGSEKPAVVSASASQDLHKESSDHLLVSPFKSKLENVLGVKLHLKKTYSIPQDYFERINIQEASVGQDGQFNRHCPSTELLQVIKPSLDQDRPKPTSQSSVNQEPRPYSHRPVMAVKPSKSDESQADCFSIDVHSEKSPKNKPPKTSRFTCTIPASMLSEKRTKEKSKGRSERLNNDNNQESSELSSKNTWFPDVSHSKSNSAEAKFALVDPSYQCQRKDITKFNMIPSSSPSMQSFESAESSSKLPDGIQGFLTNGLVEKVEQTVKMSIEMDLKDSPSALASFMDHKDNDNIGESLILGPQSSLVCTVYNNSQKTPYSFLEQISQRCLQDDLTQASVEQECLIFSEQMKQVLKKSERGPIHQEDTHDNIRLSCTSPMTINFSNLDEQEDSLDHLGTSLIRQKIKVDLSDRKEPTDKTEEEKTLRPGELSQGKDNTVEHAWLSDVTVECARLYEAKMHDICAFKKFSSRPKRFRKIYSKTEPSNHFDFCDQMKREMDKTFRTNLNSVVKKSCRTKYRFYILATSVDVFFEQTKAQLEAEGHTAVQPSEFFLGEDSSSSLIIILRNEDIAEHICEVPHLLELKKSPGVQFAGIDEPDDVVNLTYQELFTQGGFIMFDRAALDALSLCNMKKVSEILLELSKMGKWKWMLHYRDSRRLKESARLNAEAKEKKHFLYWSQDAGILEVLPYHDCDQMSKDKPDYLTCLVHLQVQKISSRYLVFITDTAADSAFEKNGILTMTLNSFLTKPLSETFAV